MDKQNDENMKELFERFIGSDETKQVLEDAETVEGYFGGSATPRVGAEVIEDIKAEVAGALRRQKARVFSRALYRVVAVAAVFIIVAVSSVMWFKKDVAKPEDRAYARTMPKADWESDDIAADDDDLAILVAELEQIEDEAMVLQLGENDDNGSSAIGELEMELIEINSNFWKG